MKFTDAIPATLVTTHKYFPPLSPLVSAMTILEVSLVEDMLTAARDSFRTWPSSCHDIDGLGIPLKLQESEILASGNSFSLRAVLDVAMGTREYCLNSIVIIQYLNVLPSYVCSDTLAEKAPMPLILIPAIWTWYTVPGNR